VALYDAQVALGDAQVGLCAKQQMHFSRVFAFLPYLICVDFLYHGGLFETAEFDGSQLPQKH